MTRLLVLGARQRPPRLRKHAEWSLFDEARIVLLDTDRGAAEVVFRYTSPPERCAPELPSQVFKAGSWSDGRLLLCTQTEVLELDPDAMRVLATHSHPWMNDVHHVDRFDGALQVVTTGLDGLLELRGEEARLRYALEGDPWERFDRATDYRRVPHTKPHEAHPNFVFRTAHGTWLTRFHPSDAVCLDDPSKRMDIAVGHPHDGHPHGGRVWFTTVNGHVVSFDAASCGDKVDHDLNAVEGAGVPLGWCRGLALADGAAFVGFTRIRATRWRKNLSWIRHGFQLPKGYTPFPTRVVRYDLDGGRRTGEWDLEGLDLNVIFSVLPADPPPAEGDA